jgi:uncharacterized membrane protein YphA (DoxX/SURF4 family)
MLASMFIAGGADALRKPQALASAAKPVTDTLKPVVDDAAPGAASLPADTEQIVRINGAVQVVAGLALATGHFPRLAALVLAGTLGPTTVAGHAFWDEGDPQRQAEQRIHFIKNVSMAGGLLMATLDPSPHKKMLVNRARDSVVSAKDRVVKQLPS